MSDTFIHPLRAFREKSDPPMTQDALAKLINGVSRETIWRWESGERFPDRKHWPRIEEVTGITADELAKASTALDEKRGAAA